MDVLAATAAEIMAQTGNKVIPLACDVRDPDAVARLFDGLAEATGGRTPTLVVNNAAGNFVAPFERLTPGGWRAITEIVLNGESVEGVALRLYCDSTHSLDHLAALFSCFPQPHPTPYPPPPPHNIAQARRL